MVDYEVAWYGLLLGKCRRFDVEGCCNKVIVRPRWHRAQNQSSMCSRRMPTALWPTRCSTPLEAAGRELLEIKVVYRAAFRAVRFVRNVYGLRAEPCCSDLSCEKPLW